MASAFGQTSQLLKLQVNCDGHIFISERSDIRYKANVGNNHDFLAFAICCFYVKESGAALATKRGNFFPIFLYTNSYFGET